MADKDQVLTYNDLYAEITCMTPAERKQEVLVEYFDVVDIIRYFGKVRNINKNERLDKLVIGTDFKDAEKPYEVYGFWDEEEDFTDGDN